MLHFASVREMRGYNYRNYDKIKLNELFDIIKSKYDLFISDLYLMLYDYEDTVRITAKQMFEKYVTNYEFIYDENGNFVEYKIMG